MLQWHCQIHIPQLNFSLARKAFNTAAYMDGRSQWDLGSLRTAVSTTGLIDSTGWCGSRGYRWKARVSTLDETRQPFVIYSHKLHRVERRCRPRSDRSDEKETSGKSGIAPDVCEYLPNLRCSCVFNT